jgi:hypothetical protein
MNNPVTIISGVSKNTRFFEGLSDTLLFILFAIFCCEMNPLHGHIQVFGCKDSKKIGFFCGEQARNAEQRYAEEYESVKHRLIDFLPEG